MLNLFDHIFRQCSVSLVITGNGGLAAEFSTVNTGLGMPMF